MLTRLSASFTKDGTYCNPDTYPGVSGEALARIVHTRFGWGSRGDFEGGDGVQEADFGLILGLSGLVRVAEWAPGVFLALMRKVWNKVLRWLKPSSLSCVNKCFFEVQPAGIAQRFAQARWKVSW